MPGEAIWQHMIQENPSVAEAPPTPLGELTALPDSLAAGDLATPSPQTPPPLSGLRAFGLRHFGSRLSCPPLQN